MIKLSPQSRPATPSRFRPAVDLAIGIALTVIIGGAAIIGFFWAVGWLMRNINVIR